jgi:hypothetical protein
MRSVLAFVVAAAVLVAACSDSGNDTSLDAEQRAVCTSTQDLQSSVDEFTGDVSSGSFDAAADQLPVVDDAAKALATAVEKLGGSQEQSIERELAAMESTVGELSSANSLSDASASIDQLERELTEVVDSVEDTVSC